MSDAAKVVQAVLGRTKPAGAVSSRDFKQPRRLGAERLSELRRLVKNLLPALEKRMHESSGLTLGLAIEALGERDADALFTGAVEPLCVLRFRCQKEPAWLAWDSTEAVSTVETIFGARASSGSARVLSPAEVKVASLFLAELVKGVAPALGIAPADFTLVQVASELGSWREAGEGAQSHRLELALALTRGETKSIVRMFLPGVSAGAVNAIDKLPARLPGHLERVEVELSARLSGCEISLDQLLALEEGDVIPLDARLGDPTTLSVEGLTLAHARLGSHRGRLAVRIERLHVEPEPAA
ncbi:MAG: FliM/FliN family flagellar motor switch protein [Planctomycetota bacterium]